MIHPRNVFFLSLLLAAQSVLAHDITSTDSTHLAAKEIGEGKRIEKRKLDKADYIPELHGTVRAKYEYQPEMGMGRFLVRNARIAVVGNVLPIVSYKAEIDLSNEGQIQMLDAWVRVFPVKGLSFTAGQMRVPFTIDAHRGPHTQYFANRSFIAKQVGNVRDVGFTLEYDLPIKMPITLSAGMYNGKGLTGQKNGWTKDFCYSGKLSFMFVPGLNLTLSAKTIQPLYVRETSYDAGMYYKVWRFHLEGEYLYKQYAKQAFHDVHAANAMLMYHQPLPKVFEKLSFLMRYDFMTDQSDSKTYEYIKDYNGENILDSNGEALQRLAITDYGRQRLTAGVTLSFSGKRYAENGKIGGVWEQAAKQFMADLRINYEKYFYNQPNTAKEAEQDKFVVELMLRF